MGGLHQWNGNAGMSTMEWRHFYGVVLEVIAWSMILNGGLLEEEQLSRTSPVEVC